MIKGLLPIKEASLGGFEPLRLEKGDRVRWRGPEYAYRVAPDTKDICTVHSVFAAPEPPDANGAGALIRPDFSILFVDTVTKLIVEYPFDSRYFVKV